MMMTTPSYDALWRPLRQAEQNALWGSPDMRPQNLLATLDVLIWEGTEAEKKRLLI